MNIIEILQKLKSNEIKVGTLIKELEEGIIFKTDDYKDILCVEHWDKNEIGVNLLEMYATEDLLKLKFEIMENKHE